MPSCKMAYKTYIVILYAPLTISTSKRWTWEESRLDSWRDGLLSNPFDFHCIICRHVSVNTDSGHSYRSFPSLRDTKTPDLILSRSRRLKTRLQTTSINGCYSFWRRRERNGYEWKSISGIGLRKMTDTSSVSASRAVSANSVKMPRIRRPSTISKCCQDTVKIWVISDFGLNC